MRGVVALVSLATIDVPDRPVYQSLANLRSQIITFLAGLHH